VRAAYPTRPKGLPLIVVGGILAVLGAAGLGFTLWLGGPDPSLWFIISASGGHEIAGWTITLAFASAPVTGTGLMVLGRRRSSS